mgnify:CR=1 FL=1
MYTNLAKEQNDFRHFLYFFIIFFCHNVLRSYYIVTLLYMMPYIACRYIASIVATTVMCMVKGRAYVTARDCKFAVRQRLAMRYIRSQRQHHIGDRYWHHIVYRQYHHKKKKEVIITNDCLTSFLNWYEIIETLYTD